MAPGTSQSGVGRVIAGRYLLLHRLGTGGMGHVWLAHDQHLACEVALKEIVFRNPAEAAQERAARVARARAEARHAAGLRGHPHVVTVHDVLEHEGLPWIVMEYVAGALDLRDLVTRRGTLAPAECARIGLAVLDALTAGHERGIMHRDVKPANILLAPDRSGSPHARVLLTDYGISVQPDSSETRWTLTSVLVGTAGYLAPERAQGGPPTAAADLFSLGCTLYYGVEGHGPFDRDTELAALTAVVLEEPRPPLRAGALEPLLAAMLTKNPVHRITAEDAEAALSAIVTPQSHPHTRVDLGSQPPWAQVETEASALPPPGPGFGPPPHGPQTGQVHAPQTGQVHRPQTGPAGRRHHRRSNVLQSVTAGLLGLAIALGGVWYAMGQRTDGGSGSGGSAKPYGETIGLAKPLENGDCVIADWSDERFEGTPRLKVEDCLKGQPDGQVMAVAGAGTADEARANGPAQCEERTEETRKRLADVRGYVVLPTDAGFQAAGRRSACLLLGANGGVYGPLGQHRRPGLTFIDTANMQKQDCLDERSDRDARLASCDAPHDQRVLGFTRLDPDTTLEEAKRESLAACAADVPPIQYGYDPARYETAAWASRSAWKTGTHFVVCTVKRQDGGTMESDEP
ncbi:serine/threonine protein phosphatase [Streptomyces montanus]|uniref:non-specific serine/threonine protein kinase n=1 Tax=Streptomyces montanus TaxID=2580423 RepID=A0A5R9FP01_9ACTN|nr:serine/threonine-protein kinase [Streptomyces montanus]TLS43660.1 serine/threonine protein phosphatase [Streptomyces montanus]